MEYVTKDGLHVCLPDVVGLLLGYERFKECVINVVEEWVSKREIAVLKELLDKATEALKSYEQDMFLEGELKKLVQRVCKECGVHVSMDKISNVMKNLSQIQRGDHEGD